MDLFETLKSLLWRHDIQDEICALLNQFRFLMIVNHIYNIIPLISFGFIEYDKEDVAPPILEDYIWLTTNYHRDTHNVIHFYLIVFLNHPFCTARFFQLFQNEYPFMDYYNFLFTPWIFLYNQDPEDEILVLLHHFDFL